MLYVSTYSIIGIIWLQACSYFTKLLQRNYTESFLTM